MLVLILVSSCLIENNNANQTDYYFKRINYQHLGIRQCNCNWFCNCFFFKLYLKLHRCVVLCLLLGFYLTVSAQV